MFDFLGIPLTSIFFAFSGLSVLLALIATAFWIWMIIDVVKAPKENFGSENEKLLWLLVVILVHWIGALIYFFVGRKESKRF